MLARSPRWRPATTLRVSATRPSMGRAGWAQVKISRSRSSCRKVMSVPGPGSSRSSAMPASSTSLLRSVAARRSRSIARRLAVVVSQAAGLSGIPSRGHRRRARSVASATASSARSQSPVVRMSVATIRSRSAASPSRSTRRAGSGDPGCGLSFTRRRRQVAKKVVARCARARRWDAGQPSRWLRRGRRSPRCRIRR
jgi:hypothetical protein